MKIHNAAILLDFVLILIVVSGCAQSSGGLVPTSSTVSVSVTNTKMSISSFTPSPTDTPTATFVSTLPVDQAQLRLLELLSNNGNCRLPCLFGITPGKSTFQEAQNILAPLSSISVLTNLNPSGGSISPWYREGDMILSTTVGFNLGSSSGNQNLSYLTFKAGEYKELAGNRSLVYDSKTFGERLRPYMLPSILSELGKPASVVIHTSGKQITGSGGFDILLFYPDQGILVHYTTQMETVGTIVHGCPANAKVELMLYPSGNADAFYNALSQTEWAFVWPELADNPSWKPIDKATSMSIEQFYETFRQPTDTCIETPLKGWHVPEQ